MKLKGTLNSLPRVAASAARLLAALVGVLLAGACPAAAAAPAASSAPSLTHKTFAEVAVYPARDAPAAAQSLNEAKVAAEVAGNIAAIPVEVGQIVPAGTVLVRLDAYDYELAAARAKAQLDAAQARLKLAESQLKRYRELREQSFISTEALAQRETEVQVQRAEVALSRTQLDSARRSLAKATIRSPYRAIVKQRTAAVGELANAGTQLLTLVDLSRLEVAAQVQVKDIDSLRAAKEVKLEALGRSYPLTLERVSPAINRDMRNVEVRLAFAAEAAPPGADGRIVWRDTRPHLPPELLSRRDGQLGVFVLNSDQPRFVPLPQAQEGRPVAADLPRDTRIVIEGRHSLRGSEAVPAAVKP